MVLICWYCNGGVSSKMGGEKTWSGLLLAGTWRAQVP